MTPTITSALAEFDEKFYYALTGGGYRARNQEKDIASMMRAFLTTKLEEAYRVGREDTLPDWQAYRKAWEELRHLASSLATVSGNVSAEKSAQLALIRNEIDQMETRHAGET